MKPFSLVVIGALLAPGVFAQQQNFVANPAASEVRITLKTTHEVVNGTFHIQYAMIGLDRGAAKMSGVINVLSGSGKTGNDIRDKKMHNTILEVEQYATISFAPTSWTGSMAQSGDSTVKVNGVFTLLGTPHAITVPVVIHIEGANATARAHFVIPYTQWGLKDPSFLFWKADKEVAVDLVLGGHVSH